ncbi:hypothetical protein ARMGADRAFT_1037203 [Armillaria gallica]|uniref:Uncharacterized protein n=1 Tax=Armillaria gallica TaxID=47427 RepID=A0A2H3D9W0_ARMGA|nr:hypothetical protein ARMGADRAFT_1037203 [Armillaria gallica]
MTQALDCGVARHSSPNIDSFDTRQYIVFWRVGQVEVFEGWERMDNQLGSSGTKTPFSYSSTIDLPETFERTLVWRKGGAEFGFLKVERVVSMTMMTVEMEGRAWFNSQSVLLFVVQFIMVIRFLEAAGKLDVGIAFQ